MRFVVGAGVSHRHVRGSAKSAVPPQPGPHSVQSLIQRRANIAQLFFDLRGALRLTPYQVAAHLFTHADVIQSLETGQFDMLPPWPETERIVLAYAAMAGFDGQPVLHAIADLLQQSTSRPRAGLRPVARRVQVERIRLAGTAIAKGARRIPGDALKHARERPDRAFYAVSLPLALVLLLLNTSALQAAFGHIPRPVARMVIDVRQFFQEQFAPVREGLRWIDVDEPRRRRSDKLR